LIFVCLILSDNYDEINLKSFIFYKKEILVIVQKIQ